jgi:hypothetical protein
MSLKIAIISSFMEEIKAAMVPWSGTVPQANDINVIFS